VIEAPVYSRPVRYREAAAFAIGGLAMVVIGLVLLVAELSDRVSDLLVTTGQDRTLAGLGALLIVLGALALLMGAIVGLVVWSRSRAELRAAPPGWYRQGAHERWWDGRVWGPFRPHDAQTDGP
jgi:hypothetical protein